MPESIEKESKSIIKIIGFIFALIVVIILGFQVFWKYTKNQLRNHAFNYFVGEYKIDLSNTTLDGYSKDSVLYEKLTLKIKKDSTFNFNMKVPFIFDSCGKWSAGSGEIVIGILILSDERSRLYFKNCTYDQDLMEYMDSEICLDVMAQPGMNEIRNGIFLKRIVK